MRLLQEALVIVLKQMSQFGLSGSEYRYYACPDLVPLFLAAPVEIHEKTW